MSKESHTPEALDGKLERRLKVCRKLGPVIELTIEEGDDILAHLRELASLKSRGVTMSQEHLDTLLRQEREKALNEAEAAVRAIEKEESDNMYQAYCDIAHNTATRCADAVAGVPK